MLLLLSPSRCPPVCSVHGDVLASGGADNSVRIWDLALSSPLGSAVERAESNVSVAPMRTFATKSTPVCHVRWTRRNLLLAGGSFDVSN